jgi:hypothetical protein
LISRDRDTNMARVWKDVIGFKSDHRIERIIQKVQAEYRRSADTLAYWFRIDISDSLLDFTQRFGNRSINK